MTTEIDHVRLIHNYSGQSHKCTLDLWVTLLGDTEVAHSIAACTQGEKMENIASIPNELILDALMYSNFISDEIHRDPQVLRDIFDALDYIRMLVLV
jgi:hypothetical protein